MSKRKYSLFKKCHCWRPTILGWIIILVVMVAIFRVSLDSVYSYLAIDKPIKSRTMIIEGFVPLYILKEAVKTYKEENYDRVIVTGIPIVNYEYVTAYHNTGEATILALRFFGLTDTIYLANIPTNVYVDRTYHTAIACKQLFDNNNWPKDFNIYSVGVHARRSRMMFRKAFGDDYEIGVIAPRDRTFLPAGWWKSSKGFRNVSNEFVATTFVTFFFHPDYDKSVNRISLGKYIDTIYFDREKKTHEFRDSTTSRFNKEERINFKGFKYYDPNINYKVTASFTVDTSSAPFGMKTSTDRVPSYRAYGYLDFKINDTIQRLTAYQNINYMHHPEHGKYLFIPFKDLTNTHTTYGAGRYIDIKIPAGDSVVLDFNNSYNPYCAYYDRWSCPLVPFENHLDTKIPAGEKKYK